MDRGGRRSTLRPALAVGLSVVAHAGLAILLGFGAVAILARQRDDDRTAPIVSLEFAMPETPAAETPPDPPSPAREAATRPAIAIPASAPVGTTGPSTPVPVPAATAIAGEGSAPVPPRRAAGASFAGLRAGNVRSVVFVVDASGSMMASLRTVIDELARSLSRLNPTQRFSIVFFQRNGAIAAPPEGRLRPATPEAIRTAIDWARREIRPAGRSDPIAALERALALEPDAIFLLGTAVTGTGDFEASTDEILARLERLNPIDAESGRRKVEIQCIQYLDPDPAGTLRAIAGRHSGDYGFRFVSRESLGLGPLDEPAPR